MNPYVITTCVSSVVGLSLVWCICFRRLRRDDFRADIRQLRDCLFDLMWQGGHDYQAPAYHELRQSLNGLLRLSSYLTPVRVLVIAYSCRDMEEEVSGDWQRLLASIDDPRLRKKFEEAQEAAMKRTMQFVFGEGVFGRVIWWAARIVPRAYSKLRMWALFIARIVFATADAFGAPTLTGLERRLVERPL